MISLKQQTDASAPTVYMLVGGPGAGKSYIRKRTEELCDLPVVDCDQFKEKHPDYDPDNPGAVHEWSKKMCKRAYYRALSKGDDFVYDGTGTSTDRYVKWINDAHDVGFNVELVYVQCSMATALERNRNRERVVPEEIVREKHAMVSTSLDILSRYADRIHTIDNN